MNTPKEHCPKIILTVTAAEEDQKLLRFLVRHTKQSNSMLHKWIRTGQVRINGKRAKPFTLLQAGDEVRLPPFALDALSVQISFPENSTDEWVNGFPYLGSDSPIVYRDDSILALHKPSGLAVQPGSLITDSVVDRLNKAFAGQPYIPSPAHRIDRHTSGLLLCGLTHKAQQQLHAWFAKDHMLEKEYLVWTSGEWQEKEKKLEDRLEKKIGKEGRETVHRVEQGGKQAISYVTLIEKRKLNVPNLPATISLLHVRLITGRMHQIRVQLSSRGCPIIGDPKYKGIHYFPMLLHAWRISLPDKKVIEAFPKWSPPFDIALDTLL